MQVPSWQPRQRIPCIKGFNIRVMATTSDKWRPIVTSTNCRTIDHISFSGYAESPKQIRSSFDLSTWPPLESDPRLKPRCNLPANCTCARCLFCVIVFPETAPTSPHIRLQWGKDLIDRWPRLARSLIQVHAVDRRPSSST